MADRIHKTHVTIAALIGAGVGLAIAFLCRKKAQAIESTTSPDRTIL